MTNNTLEWLTSQDNNALVNCIAVFIALLALISTIWQAIASRRHNRKSITPHISFYSGFMDENKGDGYCIQMENCGIGPAIVKKLIILVDNKEVGTANNESNWTEALKIVDGLNYDALCYNLIDEDGFMKVGEKFNLLWYITNEDDPKLNNIFDKISFKVEYKSLYGKKFNTESMI